MLITGIFVPIGMMGPGASRQGNSVLATKGDGSAVVGGADEMHASNSGCTGTGCV